MYNSFCVILPVYNTSKFLPGLLDRLTIQYPGISIVAIDDGSSDNSGEIARSYRGVHLLRHERNRGKGAALKTGIHYMDAQIRAKAAIFLDSDGQHDPAEIIKFVHAYHRNEGTFLIGKRDFRDQSMPPHRMLSNWLTSYLLRRKLSQNISDSQCGFRLIDAALLRRCLPIAADGYEFETELLIKAARLDAKFRNIAISTIYGTEKSNIRKWRDTIAFIKTYFRT